MLTPTNSAVAEPMLRWSLDSGEVDTNTNSMTRWGLNEHGSVRIEPCRYNAAV